MKKIPETKLYEHVTVAVKDCAPLEYNPDDRTDRKKLKGLIQSIQTEGFLVPIALGSDGIIGDGNRRAAAARIVGLEEISALRYKNKTSSELFIIMNDPETRKAISRFDYLEIWVRTEFVAAYLPPKQASLLSKMAQYIDKSTFRQMLERGKSPAYIEHVRTAILKFRPSHSYFVGTESSVINTVVLKLLANNNKQDLWSEHERLRKGLIALEDYERIALELIDA